MTANLWATIGYSFTIVVVVISVVAVVGPYLPQYMAERRAEKFDKKVAALDAVAERRMKANRRPVPLPGGDLA